MPIRPRRWRSSSPGSRQERRTRENGDLKDVDEGVTQQSLCAPLSA